MKVGMKGLSDYSRNSDKSTPENGSIMRLNDENKYETQNNLFEEW
jgi:hypothetical protein